MLEDIGVKAAKTRDRDITELGIFLMSAKVLLGLGNLDRGRDGVREFNELGHHARVEMPSCKHNWLAVIQPQQSHAGIENKKGSSQTKNRAKDAKANTIPGRANSLVGGNADKARR